MAIEIRVPVLPESVSDATVAAWHKKPGDTVLRDEKLVDLETDKVVLEVPAPQDGVMGEILKTTGSLVTAEEVLGLLQAGEGAVASSNSNQKIAGGINTEETLVGVVGGPAARREATDKQVDVAAVAGTGRGGRVVREDVEAYFQKQQTADNKSHSQAGERNTKTVVTPLRVVETNQAQGAMQKITVTGGDRVEKRVPMTRLRARIAERLLQAKQNTAMLTTFNEVNLQAIVALRKQHKERFEKQHGVRLGLMSFFTKAVVEALKRFPDVNASIDGNDIIYHGYYDIGIAVSTERGLVVPILRNADQLSLADIERTIADYAEKARDGKLTLDEMTGGTFTITNGGVFGSLLATPILNPPQSGILGMHKMEDRAVVENGQIVIRPMMYVALSYDHRIIDGKESVSFLVAVKEILEDPTRLLLEI